MRKPKQANITVARLRDLNAERRELDETVRGYRNEVDRLKRERTAAMFLARTLEAERGCLQARLIQIDQALLLLLGGHDHQPQP